MRLAPLFVLLALGGCVRSAPVSNPLAEEEPAPEPSLNDEAVVGVEHPALRALLSDHWEHTMARSPSWATMLGDRRFDDQLPDASAAASAASTEAARDFLARAQDIVPSELSAAERTTLALFIEELQADLASEVCHFEQWSLSPRSNPAVDFNHLVDTHTVRTLADLESLLARYQALPRYTEQSMEQLRAGLAAGRVANADTVRLVIEQVQDQVDAPVAEWALAAVPMDAVSEEERAAVLHEELLSALDGPFRAALVDYLALLRDEVLPAARPASEVGVGHLPDGPACYDARVAAYTTLDRSAAEVHQIGLDEMERIHGEFAALGQTVFGTSDVQEVFVHLRTDPELLFETSEQVEQTAIDALAAAREAIPAAFGRLPQAECVVREVPANEAPYTTIAYYGSPAADGSRPGTYYVNTYAPETRPRHEARVLAYHESIPGHHLQIAIAQELPGLPAFRRYGGQTAFVEGWGLYSERLADELGLYPSDVDRLGMLSFDAWRAARLVVDTGIHSKGWTREQAEQYMRDNTPLATNNIANEVDRYISWPGQALAYKTGQLHILEQRHRAEAELGDAFDLSAFHDVVLGGGAVSLPELTRRVDAWLAAQASE